MTFIPVRRFWPAWAPTIVLSALLLGAFHGALAGRLFYLRDVTQNHLPVRTLVSARLAEGQLPLWDPYHGGGTPLFANPNHLVAHPITLLFFVLPLQAAFTASIVLQFALLACGGYLLARALPVGREAAALGAAVMAFSGPAASLASMLNVLSAAAWVPLALWAFLRLLEEGRPVHRVLAIVALAVALLPGEAASVLTFAALAPALALTRPPADGGRLPGGGPGRVAGALLVVVGLAAAVAALQIVPAADLVRLSPRATGLPEGETLKWSLHPARMFELWLPQIFGDPTRLSPEGWWGSGLFEGGYPFLLSIYLGAAPLLLAVAAVVAGAGRLRAAVLAGIAALFLLLALGEHTPLYRWLCSGLLPLRQVRYPERFLIGAAMAMSLLAALGLDHLVRARQGSRAWRWFAAGSFSLFAMATAVVVEPTLADSILRGSFRLPEAMLRSGSGAVIRGAVLRSVLWACTETAALASCAAVLARGGRRSAVWAAWGMAGICGASVVIATAPTRSTAARGWISAPSPLAPVVGHGPDAPRLHHAPRPDALGIWARTDEQIWGFRFDRFTYSMLTGHSDDVPTILDPATDRLDLAASSDLGTRLANLPVPDQVRVLRLAHAGFLLSYEDLRDAGLVPGPVLEGLSRPPLRVYHVAGLIDRARFVSRARPPRDPSDLARSLADPGFDPQTEVLLEGAQPTGAPAPEEPGLARVLQDDPERVTIAVEAPQPGYLVLADSFAPGWRARLDGAAVPLLRANGLFRAVAVPSGRHHVEMTYAPASVVLGAAVSGCGLVLTAFWAGRRRHMTRCRTT